ncbi:tetratricopeptide repeat protein [Candidatus Bathyarchaeota archaeon]|nr:tetratricopeptide repeat protein [Candidatus Bathyarchaeota archaeon]
MGERTLAAIMFTDIVGYTALSENDEQLAITLLEEHRTLLRPIFAQHGGREVKTIGDGFLVEFRSVLEAVRCALEIQRQVNGRNAKVSRERQFLLRVAVHLGDVEHRDGDLYGDAVNVASRIQLLADPGGVCITRQVYDHVRNNREFKITPSGQTLLKNVQNPTEIFRLEPATERVDLPTSRVEQRRVAVLPLTAIGSQQEDDYFADGLTEEIINTLSTIPDLKVIARTSIMKYKQAVKSIGEIGRELKVGTIIEGSVRKAGNRLRITAQLIDVASEAPVWAQKYDREIRDMFEIQTDIAERVAEALKVQLLAESKTRIEQKAPEDIGAYVLYLRGRYYWSRRNRQDIEKAIQLFGEAIQKDPNYALAHAGMADCYILMGRHRYLSAKDTFPKAREHVEKALMINEGLAEAHSALAAILFNYNWNWGAAEDQFKRAIELNPNYATAHYWYSVLLLTTGNLKQAIVEAEKAQLLDPLSSVVGIGVIEAYFFSGQYDKAIEECKKYLELDPNFIMARDFLVHLYVQKQFFTEAEREARRLVETSERKGEAAAHLPYVLASSKRTDEARKLFDAIASEAKLNYANATIFITVYSLLGDQDSAFSWAMDALDNGKIAFPSLRFSPDLNDFRADRRYVSLLEEAHLG